MSRNYLRSKYYLQIFAKKIITSSLTSCLCNGNKIRRENHVFDDVFVISFGMELLARGPAALYINIISMSLPYWVIRWDTFSFILDRVWVIASSVYLCENILCKWYNATVIYVHHLRPCWQIFMRCWGFPIDLWKLSHLILRCKNV